MSGDTLPTPIPHLHPSSAFPGQTSLHRSRGVAQQLCPMTDGPGVAPMRRPGCDSDFRAHLEGIASQLIVTALDFVFC